MRKHPERSDGLDGRGDSKGRYVRAFRAHSRRIIFPNVERIADGKPVIKRLESNPQDVPSIISGPRKIKKGRFLLEYDLGV